MDSEPLTVSEQERLLILEKLVDELLKDEPEEPLVKACMKKAGIKYTDDPIERINTVLRALHFKEADKDFK